MGARQRNDAREDAPPVESVESLKERRNLGELMTETRILLPGTQVFLAFLMTLPFTERFDALTSGQRGVYLCTFFSTLLALACFVVPAAYHRIARPIRHKERFKVFANRFVVAGLAPVSVSLVLVTNLVTSVVGGARFGFVAAAVMTLVVAALWWLLPLARMHDRYPYRERPRSPGPGPTSSTARPEWKPASRERHRSGA